MRSSSSSLLVISLLALAVAACGSSGSDSPPGAGTSGGGDPNSAPSPAGPDGGPGPVAPPVPETPSNDDLTEQFGIFVSPSGADNGDGTRAHPLARIQPAIDLAKTIGKRVYVCSGLYREALVIADSISVIGGLDCSRSDAWRTGAARVRLDSPTSPAITARDIVSATRLEGLEVTAPAATTPGGSSIGLHGERANSLVVAKSKIAAGAGAKGDDGTEGTQLVNGPAVNGGAVLEARDCTLYANCAFIMVLVGNQQRKVYMAVAGGAGGANTCVAPGGALPESGATGGTGGMYVATGPTTADVYDGKFSNAAAAPTQQRNGTAGGAGADAPAAAPVGNISADGYLPADGAKGADGASGSGGAGGTGARPDALMFDGNVTRGWAGAGGGAGGCPGVAGSAGKGGGASVAALLLDSAVTFDATELASGAGGGGGLGTFGSMPTYGGAAGPNAYAVQRPALSAQPGGQGGAAGVSSNGSNGPSVAIAHKGVAPVIKAGTVLKPGTGAPAILARSRDTLGVTKTIPSTPAGVADDILAL